MSNEELESKASMRGADELPIPKLEQLAAALRELVDLESFLRSEGYAYNRALRKWEKPAAGIGFSIGDAVWFVVQSEPEAGTIAACHCYEDATLYTIRDERGSTFELEASRVSRRLTDGELNEREQAFRRSVSDRKSQGAVEEATKPARTEDRPALSQAVKTRFPGVVGKVIVDEPGELTVALSINDATFSVNEEIGIGGFGLQMPGRDEWLHFATFEEVLDAIGRAMGEAPKEEPRGVDMDPVYSSPIGEHMQLRTIKLADLDAINAKLDRLLDQSSGALLGRAQEALAKAESELKRLALERDDACAVLLANGFWFDLEAGPRGQWVKKEQDFKVGDPVWFTDNRYDEPFPAKVVATAEGEIQVLLAGAEAPVSTTNIKLSRGKDVVKNEDKTNEVAVHSAAPDGEIATGTDAARTEHVPSWFPRDITAEEVAAGWAVDNVGNLQGVPPNWLRVSMFPDVGWMSPEQHRKDFPGPDDADESKPSEAIREIAQGLAVKKRGDSWALVGAEEFNEAVRVWLDKTFDAEGRRRDR